MKLLHILHAVIISKYSVTDKAVFENIFSHIIQTVCSPNERALSN